MVKRRIQDPSEHQVSVLEQDTLPTLLCGDLWLILRKRRAAVRSVGLSLDFGQPCESETHIETHTGGVAVFIEKRIHDMSAVLNFITVFIALKNNSF